MMCKHKNVLNEWVMDSYYIIFVRLVHILLVILDYSDPDHNLRHRIVQYTERFEFHYTAGPITQMRSVVSSVRSAWELMLPTLLVVCMVLIYIIVMAYLQMPIYD